VTETEDQVEEKRTERIVISLHPPMLFDVALRLMRAINREFPGARWLPGDADGNLVIEVDADWRDKLLGDDDA
jgi:hypothetical protein